MQYDVPFTSQYEGIADPDWQWRGCGIVALKMVMDFWHTQSPANRTEETEALRAVGVKVGAYREGIGWVHGGLAEVARTFGYRSYNRDFATNGPTPKSAEAAFEEMSRELESGPVLASVFSGMEPERGGGHIVVVTAEYDGVVSFSDPEQVSERDGERTIALPAFLKAFKRRYVCVLPPP